MHSKTYVLIWIMTMNLSVFANLVHNLSNPYVVAVKKEISGDTVVVGRVLDQSLLYL